MTRAGARNEEEQKTEEGHVGNFEQEQVIQLGCKVGECLGEILEEN
jgi:hypothetical protein